MFADAPQELDVPAKILEAYKKMAPEALALNGSRHFQDYHSLLALTDEIAYDGIEHHQSSDDRAPARFMMSRKWQMYDRDLLAHEFSHFWNGKYRRPWDLAMFYSQMSSEPGRASKPLIDLTTSAPYLYQAQGEYSSIRRTADDFYTEGELLWLDVDTIIRTETHGKKSLDAFLHLYSAPARTGPITKIYTRADIERLLNEVAPYDWHGLFERRDRLLHAHNEWLS